MIYSKMGTLAPEFYTSPISPNKAYSNSQIIINWSDITGAVFALDFWYIIHGVVIVNLHVSVWFTSFIYLGSNVNVVTTYAERQNT